VVILIVRSYLSLYHFLNNYLALNISEENITFALKSDSIFENDINLDKTLLLELPPGRFFYVSNIKKV
jgi:hypothetical protein